MQKQAAEGASPPAGSTPPSYRPRRSALGRLLAVLAFGLILALAVGGVILFRQVIRMDHDLDSAAAELRALRGQQAPTEHRVGDLADDVRDVRTTVDRTAARELDTATVVHEAQDSVFTIYIDQAQGTAFAVFPTDDGGPGWPPTPHVVEDVLGADRMVRLVQGKRSWRDEVATWQDQPDVALIRVAGELPTLSVAAEPTVGDQVLAYGSPFSCPTDQMPQGSRCSHHHMARCALAARAPPRPSPSDRLTPAGR